MGRGRAAVIRIAFLYLMLFTAFIARAEDDPASYIGMSLEELLIQFGTPESVYPVRGLEEWQDDVVFVYEEGDFYILKDRVWQVGLKTAYRVNTGDPSTVVYLSFGEAFMAGRDFAVFSLGRQNWPLALRCNFDLAGRVTAIFIYRSDI